MFNWHSVATPPATAQNWQTLGANMYCEKCNSTVSIVDVQDLRTDGDTSVRWVEDYECNDEYCDGSGRLTIDETQSPPRETVTGDLATGQ